MAILLHHAEETNSAWQTSTGHHVFQQGQRTCRGAAVPIDNHPTAHEDISNNDTGAEDCNSNTDVNAEDTTEARVIRIREVRRHCGAHWVGIGLTPHIIVNITNGKDGLGSRWLPEEAGIAPGAPDIDKRGRERNMKDKVRQAASRPGALNSHGNIKLSFHDEPCVCVCLRLQGPEVPLAKMALNRAQPST